jgi:hypothetical protein
MGCAASIIWMQLQSLPRVEGIFTLFKVPGILGSVRICDAVRHGGIKQDKRQEWV